ncbi:hypothetical protein AWM75_01950 [Aerococcus urinaehominis]|uniref:Uncharacterized protein n=1 Tax=Aerococcus urinaehominis TaxID=128944 RepID=A0A109RHM6_9LACT|nr:hypothetical protein [Aerococcus urinaehominis]AMB98830.1 hypothetical protein AWM75_01950 [Aerococcus urinaehominis]SDM48541.1 NAD-dependent protein deacetylase, SIR2 family [Aerococcus urinaehominis]
MTWTWQSELAASAGLADHLRLKYLLDQSDYVLFGVGAGMGAADGFSYVGPRFTENFADFINKYGWFDLFQASVFEFPTLEEEWAFFSRFVDLNYLSQPVGPSYLALKELASRYPSHVITSNADNAFEAAGFDANQVFDVQGKYNLLQCSRGCHAKRYPNEALMKKMLASQDKMLVPSELVPYCPKCGAPMALNRRNHTDWMVEDQKFYQDQARFIDFLQAAKQKRLVLLELGCGYMAPQVIKHPFQQFTEAFNNVLYVTVNLKDYHIPHAIRDRSLWINQDIKVLMSNLAASYDNNKEVGDH